MQAFRVRIANVRHKSSGFAVIQGPTPGDRQAGRWAELADMVQAHAESAQGEWALGGWALVLFTKDGGFTANVCRHPDCVLAVSSFPSAAAGAVQDALTRL